MARAAAAVRPGGLVLLVQRGRRPSRRRSRVAPPRANGARRALVGLALLLGVPGGAARAGEPRHHLFAPVPRDQLREMRLDRPDRTEGPYTIDAGHLQVETEVWSGSFYSEVSGEGGETNWSGTVDVGFTWAPRENLQLDAGVNLGVTGSVDDYAPFVGFGTRF